MPISVPAASLTVEWLCLALIQLVTGSPRQPAYLRTPVWWRVTPVVLVFLLPTVASAFLFVVLLTSRTVDTISPLFGWGCIVVAAASTIASLTLELRAARRSRRSRPIPPTLAAEPDGKGPRSMTRLVSLLMRALTRGLAAGLFCLLVAGVVGGCGASSSSGSFPAPSSSYSCSALSTAAASAPNLTQTPLAGTTQETYTLSLLILPLQENFNPGNSLKITWCPVPVSLTTATQPTLEILSVHLIGPYSSKSSANSALLASALAPPVAPMEQRAPSGPMVASTTPLHTNDWTNTVESVTLTVPSTLKMGYYIVWSDVETQLPPVATSGPGTLEILVAGSGGGGRVIAVTDSPILP